MLLEVSQVSKRQTDALQRASVCPALADMYSLLLPHGLQLACLPTEQPTGLSICHCSGCGCSQHLLQVGAFGDSGRDPRGWCVTVAYAALVPADLQGVKAAVRLALLMLNPSVQLTHRLSVVHGTQAYVVCCFSSRPDDLEGCELCMQSSMLYFQDDAAEAEWFPVTELPSLAFDHKLVSDPFEIHVTVFVDSSPPLCDASQILPRSRNNLCALVQVVRTAFEKLTEHSSVAASGGALDASTHL